ncbi:MAG: DUF2309 domain-containing protein [Pseudomonadota bacterium]
MLMKQDSTIMTDAPLAQAADAATRQVPPLWPLATSVAVNPFLGQTGERLEMTAARLERAAGIRVTLPRQDYLAKIRSGEITEADMKAALDAFDGKKPASVEALRKAASRPAPAPKALPTVAELVQEVTGTNWPEIVADRIGVWAAGYFDQGQALWPVAQRSNAFEAWHMFARRDLTPEILGLSHFAQTVETTSRTAMSALESAALTLGLSPDAAESYFHRLMTDLSGWGQVGRYKLFEAELQDGEDSTATDLLTARMIWDAALYLQHEGEIAEKWVQVLNAYAEPIAPTEEHIIDVLLQSAADRAAERTLVAKFAGNALAKGTDRPALQAAFCIDVRSEVFRRALESVDPGIETIGFAGFFGLGVQHHSFASDVAENRLPVLLNPGVNTVTTDPSESDLSTRLAARAVRAWGRFKLAAVSSFAFVEAAGPIYAGKLVRDTLGLASHAKSADPAPSFPEAMDLATKITTAKTVLGAMSMTENLGKIVLLAGHGANVTNNPHESALHCGACGGHSGEVNARLLAILLNDSDVRAGLADEGLTIPEDTVFIAGLHDTTTDGMTLYDGDLPMEADLAQLRGWLAAAARIARDERAGRLPRAMSGNDIMERSRNWAELRPEWGLAGCSAFIAAPRHRSANRDLGGRSFLHSYDWQKDEGFGVLELILTAPVVVASWISLQYYGSTVAPEAFGGGNKVLHNVVGGIGVVEGNGGRLRGGLPMQSVHDGEKIMHDPLRLSVVIEAPAEAINDILVKHGGVKDLFDNGWLTLMVMNEHGQIAQRYVGDLTWSEITMPEAMAA